MTKRVLFVCLGNICRSPAAEAVFKAVAAKDAPKLPLEVDSAGTIDIHAGERPDPRMRAAGEVRGYRFETRARQVTADDLRPGRFDLVVAMDRSNLADLKRMAPQSSHLVLIGEFLADRWPREVPDPYYGGPAGFETVLDMLEAACPEILQRLGVADHD